MFLSLLHYLTRVQWRAPEEYIDRPLNEQIDVWSLGVNMYSLLTGLRPFYQTLDLSEMQEKTMAGETSPIDDRYRTRSLEEGKLVEIIERCWAFDPDDRPTIFEVVEFLRQAVTESDASKGRAKTT